MVEYRRILVPLDATPAAERVLPHAISIARATGAVLILLHVLTARVEVLQQAMEGDGVGKTFADVADERAGSELASVSAYLPGVQAVLNDAGVSHEVRVIEGDAKELLCETVREQQIDLVAMTAPSRSMLGRLLHGATTAESMLNDIEVPVLLLRAEKS